MYKRTTGCALKVFFWQLIDKLKQTIKTTKLYQELKIVINLEKYYLES